MERILPEHLAAIRLVVGGLKSRTAPTSIGYHDMAIMIAFGQSNEYGIPTVSADMVYKYLAKHPAVPLDARMGPETIQGYLDVLTENTLLERQGAEKQYRMRDDDGACILSQYEHLKSPHIDDFLFHGFRIHSAGEIHKQRSQGR